MYINIKQSKSICILKPRYNWEIIPSLDINAQKLSNTSQSCVPIPTLQNLKALLILEASFFEVSQN